MAKLRAEAAAYRRERYRTDPAWKARVIEHSKKALSKRRVTDVAFVERERQYQKDYHRARRTDAEYQERRRENTRSLRADPDYAARERALALEANRKRLNDSSFKEWKSAYMKDRFQRPEVRALHQQNAAARRARVANGKAEHISRAMWRAVCERFKDSEGRPCCGYCRRACAQTMDHVVPIARGGIHELSNLRPACRRCNSGKRDRLIHEWFRAEELLGPAEFQELKDYTERHLARLNSRKKVA
jgi:5-methylcytosine-specific restriction endonuclease McrA